MLPPGTVLVAARFRPGAGGVALGVPLSELLDQRIDVADLRRDVAGRLRPRWSPGGAVAAVTRCRGPPGRRPAAGRRDAERVPPAAAIRAPQAGEVAAEVGLSERQLRRRCEAAVGYGPKMLQRVLRFRRFVSLVTPGGAVGRGEEAGEYAGRLTPAGGRASLAQAAVDSGYADQPHLTRETARLAGMTPAALVRSAAPRFTRRLGQAVKQGPGG